MSKSNSAETTSNTTKLRRSIAGMSTETFVRGYREQSQMDVNTINTLDASGRCAKIIGDILRSLKNK